MELWQSPHDYWYVRYGPRLAHRISARTNNRHEAEAFMREFASALGVGTLRDQNTVLMVADYFHCSKKTVQRWIETGLLTCTRIGGTVRITRAQVQDMEARCTSSGTTLTASGTSSSESV